MNKLRNILLHLTRRSVCTVVFAGLSQIGFAQQGENPWANEPSLIDPWSDAPFNAVKTDTVISSSIAFTDTVVTTEIAFNDSVAVEKDTAIYHNVGGVMVREVDVTCFNEGKRDAFKYYKTNGAGCTGFASGVGCFAFPGFIAVPTAVGLSTPKKLSNEQNPNNYRLTEIDYANGYAEGAKKVRSRRAWGGFTFGLGFTAFVGVILISAS